MLVRYDARPHSSIARGSEFDGCGVGVTGGIEERPKCSSENFDVVITSSLLSFSIAVLCKHTTPEAGQSNQRTNEFEKFITVMRQNHRVVVRHSRYEAAFL